MTQTDTIVEAYFRSYREMVEAEEVNAGSVVLSFPFHLAANHRIEITVTKFSDKTYLISDSARTVGEIQAAGYSVSSQMLERLEKLASASGLRLVDTHFVLESSRDTLGIAIQKFLEITKTVGDAYLVHRPKEPSEKALIAQVRSILDSRGLLYKLRERILGEIEPHPVDILVPSNGRPGWAVSILSRHDTHTLAQVWGYKCEDIKRGDWYKTNPTTLALVYDVQHHQWSEASRAILEHRADIAVPSDSLGELKSFIESR
jgi:hypothetical protein